MKHLRRLERSMLAGAIVAMLMGIAAVGSHKDFAAAAAADHVSLARLIISGCAGVTLIVGVAVFIIGSVAARPRARGRGARHRSWPGR